MSWKLNQTPYSTRIVAATWLLCSLATTADAQDQIWLREWGTSNHEMITELSRDGMGGVIAAGHSMGDLGGPNAGETDVFLARFDGDSNQLWIRQFGTDRREYANGLAPDGAGGVYVTGNVFKGSLGGPSAGRNDVYLARYDGDGNRLWILQFGTNDEDVSYDLAPDGVGGVFVAGETLADLAGPSAGGYDAFLARYDDAGNRLWILQFGTDREDRAAALAPDGRGGVLIAGRTEGALVGGPKSSERDAFLARYDAEGNQLWIRQFGTTVWEEITELASDGSGGVFATGRTRGDLGGPNLGDDDVFLTRYDGEGNRLWMRQFGSITLEESLALAPDGGGGVLVAGYTSGVMGGPSAGHYDVFLAHYSRSGEQRWIRQFGSRVKDIALAIVPLDDGDTMIGGRTNGVLGGRNSWVMNPDLAQNTGSTDCCTDIFLARFTIDSCYADCDQGTGAGVLDMNDFLCFQDSFITAKPYACNCDNSTGLGNCDVFDFLCYQSAFVAGCP